MKNRDYLIMQLTDPNSIDDGGASYEATVYYNIACPYFSGDARALCYGNGIGTTREECYECKEQWLNQEVDE